MSDILIWGAGNTAEQFGKLLDMEKNQILAVVDNDKMKWGESFKIQEKKIFVVSPEEINRYQYDALIICSIQYDEIFMQCCKNGYRSVFVYTEKEKLCNLYPELFMHSDQLIFEERVMNQLIRIEDLAQEKLWHDVFYDTVKNYEWFHIKSISLGRTAVGYNYAYVLSRVLETMKPAKILELGLGQSTKILNAYFQFYKRTVTYEIIENNQSWIDFFREDENLQNVQIHIKSISLQREYGDLFYKYDDLNEILVNKKYNYISIDAPFGYYGKYLGRTDLIEFIPEILDDDWVIMVDDYQRVNEHNMIILLEERLKESDIKYYKGIYKGEKYVCLLASEKWEFLRTL